MDDRVTSKNNDNNTDLSIQSQDNYKNTSSNERNENIPDTQNCTTHSIAIKPSDFKRRVKLYKLHSTQQSSWNDVGTGYVTFRDETGEITVENEKPPPQILLKVITSKEEIYELQGNSLIVWNDEKEDTDMALSFQESDGCKEMWNMIRIYQGLVPDADEQIRRNMLEEEYEDSQTIELPRPTPENLLDILALVTPSQKDSIIKNLVESAYIDELFRVFEECEARQNIESLQLLFQIFKNIVLLNDESIFNFIFDKKRIMTLMGVFEYDPDCGKKGEHRHYLQNVVLFKEVVPFSDRSILDKIHLSFRIQYIKETILPRVLDDQTFNTLNTLIYFINMEIIETICADDNFHQQLFDKLKSMETDPKTLLDITKFLQEYNTLIRNCTVATKRRVYRKLIKFGLLDIVSRTLRDEQRFVRQNSSELIYSIMNFETSMVRRYILENYETTGECEFFTSFLKSIIDESELGVQDNLTDCLKLLMEPMSLDTDVNSFLNMFYVKFIHTFMILFETLPLDRKIETSEQKEAFFHVLDIVSFFAHKHTARSRTFILENRLLTLATQIMSFNMDQGDLVLSVIRFVRSCIALSDAYIHEGICDADVFAPILQILEKNYKQNNMLSSAVIDMLELLQINNNQPITLYIGNKYKESLEVMRDIDSIDKFLDSYQSMLTQTDNQGEQPSNMVNNSSMMTSSVHEEMETTSLVDATEDTVKTITSFTDIQMDVKELEDDAMHDVDEEIRSKRIREDHMETLDDHGESPKKRPKLSE